MSEISPPLTQGAPEDSSDGLLLNNRKGAEFLKISSPIGMIRILGDIRRGLINRDRLIRGLTTGKASFATGVNASIVSRGMGLETQIRALRQGILNLNSARSIFQSAEGLLQQQAEIIRKMKELAARASNDFLTKMERDDLDSQLQSLLADFTATTTATDIAGRRLLDGSWSPHTLQVGSRKSDSISLSIPKMTIDEVFQEPEGMTGFSDWSFDHIEQPDSSSVTSNYIVKFSDLNNDGYEDYISTSGFAGAGNVVVSLSNGDGSFAERTTYAVGNFPSYLETADLNSDGYADIITTDNTDNTLSVLLSTGTGSFAARITLATGSSPGALHASDIDNNGVKDLLVTDTSSATVSIFLSNGNGTFQARKTQTTQASANEVYTADFNGDNFQDLISAGSSSFINVNLGNGNGTFQTATTLAISSSARGLITGDFNSDGRNDISVVDAAAVISLYLGNGNATFQTRITTASDSNATAITAADFNGDGNLDLATSHNGLGSRVGVYYGNGNGTFRTRLTLQTGKYPQTIDVGDYDGDGDIDILAGTASGEILKNVGGIITAQARIGPTLDVSMALMEADVNNDGHNDIVQLEWYQHSLLVMLGSGNGVYTLGATYAIGTNPVFLRSGDFNKDGNIDFIATNTSSNTLSIILGNGNGTFQAPTTLATSNAADMEIGDFNEDGNQDIISVGAGNAVHLFLGNGNGTFQSVSTLASSFTGALIRSADLNRDGHTDIVVNQGSSSRLAILFGNGNGTFTTAITRALSSTGSALHIADMDGDGYKDILAGDFSTDLSIFYGSSDAAYSSRVTHQLEDPITTGIQTADLDNDGDLDAVTVSYPRNLISIIENRGNRNIVERDNFRVGSLPRPHIIGDFDEDGKQDLMIPESNTGATVFLRNTSESFSLSLQSSDHARQLLPVLDQALENVMAGLATVAATASRLDSIANLHGRTIESLAEAESRLTEIDFAMTIADLVKEQMLDDIRMTLLVHMNLQSELIMKLLS